MINQVLEQIKMDRVLAAQKEQLAIDMNKPELARKYKAEREEFDQRIFTIENMVATTNPTQGFTCGEDSRFLRART